MPFHRADWLVLGILMLCWPTQLLLNRLLSAHDSDQRTKAIERLWIDIVDLPNWVSDWTLLRRLTFPLLMLKNYFSVVKYNDKWWTSDSECIAVEVINYRGAEVGNFAHSTSVRSPRPEDVKYRVGQVVVHKEFGFRGVIVGWDLFANAPETWLHKMHGNQHHWRDQPNYLVLIDERDRRGHQKAYVPEESLISVPLTKIKHRHVDNYFSRYDGAQYLPRPWLRTLYPHD